MINIHTLMIIATRKAFFHQQLQDDTQERKENTGKSLDAWCEALQSNSFLKFFIKKRKGKKEKKLSARAKSAIPRG